MKKIITIFFLIVVMVFSEEAYIASFNTLHLGWSKSKDYESMADFIGYFDLVALQEVMTEDGLIKLVETLNEDKEVWQYLISPYPVGSSDYKEYYAFIWNSKSVELIEEMGYYNGENKIEFERPPYAATFKIGKFDFTLVSCHSIFGDSIRERRIEALMMIDVYEYYQRLDEKENDILIGGDFNIPAYDDAFAKMYSNDDQIYYGIDPITKTTIGKSGLSSSYDNIFYSYKYTSEYTGNSGIIDFTNGEYRKVRKSISDHLPVFIEVDTSRDDD